MEVNNSRVLNPTTITFLLAFIIIPLSTIPLAVLRVPSFLLLFITLVPAFMVFLMPSFLFASAFIRHG